MNDNNSLQPRVVRTDRVLLIYTGGTIGMGRNPITGVLEPLDFNHLVSCLPEFATLETGIDTYQFTPAIDSSDMTPRFWSQLVRIIADRYEQYDGFVIPMAGLRRFRDYARHRHYGIYGICTIFHAREPH